tara:strand:+ start:220 stop:636 length:417 start_codon:yes stop_codon:yes gene_type:complete
MKKYIVFSIITFLLSGCFSVETDNPNKAWKYWSGSEPPENIEMIKGEYYQSPHFTLEYELILKFRTDKKWFDEFVDYNSLIVDTIRHDWTRWTDLPSWFDPDKNFDKYSADPTDDFERSRYFFNPENGEAYIYETVGM